MAHNMPRVSRNDRGLHCADGPAVIYRNGRIEYWINGKIPFTLLDIVIIPEEIDFEMFPSAVRIQEMSYGPWSVLKAYRVVDPDELILAILRYG